MPTRPLHIEVVDDQMAEVLRGKTPAERLAMIFSANRTARILAEAGVRHHHPDLPASQIREEVIKRVCHGLSGTERPQTASSRNVASYSSSDQIRRFTASVLVACE